MILTHRYGAIVARMQRGLVGAPLKRRLNLIRLHPCRDAPQRTCSHATERLHESYASIVRNSPKAPTPTWQAYVLEARRLSGMSQQALADALDVNKSTVWRWENESRTPESLDLAVRVADVTRTPRDIAAAAAGFAMRDNTKKELDPRLIGLDPNDPVVRHIMALDVDEELRSYMLDRRRQILAMRREQDLQEVDIIVRRERGAA